MNYLIQSIKGMHDYLPHDTILWNKVEKILKKILFNYGYLEIRLPIIEQTNLFKKSMGEVTDIIGKEMYSFVDKGGNNVTLRPEATVSCVRSLIQHKLLYHKNHKLWYYGPMFRYERPQKGRYRQFYQFGIETFGFSEPDIELELIILISKFFHQLGISKYVTLEINSIGSVQSRIIYQKVLKKFLNDYKHILDSDCIRQLRYNALRILDSKNLEIQKLLLKAPILMDYVDQKSQLNFHQLCLLMKHFKIEYTINYQLVRGLDYYNNTVFEWKTDLLGSKNTICAGGRYDLLVEKLGGFHTPAMGLAIGMDRLLLLLKSSSVFSKREFNIDIYIIYSHHLFRIKTIDLSENIRIEFNQLNVFMELKKIKLKKILQNIKVYSSRIILFIDENILNECIHLYDIKYRSYKLINKKFLIQCIHNIFY